MPSHGLGLRLIVPLAIILAAYGSLQAYFVSSNLRDQSRREATIDTLRLADTVKRSLRYDMLNTRREHIYNIIRDIGDQEGIDFVRILNDQGRIIFSTRGGETGTVLDMQEEACVQCHRGLRPKVSLRHDDRTRVYRSKTGHRTLAAIEVIYNDTTCWNASCHVHPAGQHVLGVLDIGVSLEPTDRRVSTAIRAATFFGISSTALVCALVALFLHRFVRQPVRRLLAATQRVAAGDLDLAIPVESDDEIGRLGASFNKMTADLKSAREELRGWARTLEAQVEEKSRDLASAQAQVLRSEKLSSLGLLAAGVAHELNSPLTGIITFSHLLLRKAPKPSQQREDLETITHEAERCASIIRQLLDFAHDSPPKMTPQQINPRIERALSLVEHQALFHNVRIERKLAEDLPDVMLDGDQFQQVFLNLIVNAAEAMPDGGVLTICSEALDSSTVLKGSRRYGLCIEVSDTGVGIPKEVIGKIFDPFFSSKDVGKGTGLGLAVSYGIVKRHGGKITVESKEGQGTTFKLFLPVIEEEGQAS